jgi:anti-anti-sigma factor
MVIRAAAEDVESAKRLVVRLVGLFGGERVSLRADGEVQLQLHEESNRALAQTLDAVEHWLEETGIASADVWVDERPCRVDRPRWLPSEPEVRVAGLPGETAVISLLGEHDIATAGEVRNAIACALEQGTHPVVDLSETEFIDSTIIHVLFESKQLAQENGQRVSLQLPADARVRRALEITGMLDLLPVYGTRAEAIDAVRQPRENNTERRER